MKKTISLILVITMLTSLVACVGGKENNTDETQMPSAGIQVDEGLINVDVTLAASFFEDKTEEEIRAEAKENGYSDCKINGDGSVTYTMSKTKRAEMLNEMKTSIDGMIAGCLEGDDKVASFVDIRYNDDFSQIDIYVDAEKYTTWDRFYALTFYITGAYYQAFAGVANDEIDVAVNFIDNETGETLDTASYKDFVGNAGNGEDEEKNAGVGKNPSSATAVAEKETVTVADICEFYVDYTDITDDVVPPNPGNWYSHYEADDGKLYVDFCVSFKNCKTKSVGADDVMSAVLTYGGKYEYSGFSMIEEDSRGDFTYSGITSIAPLTTEYLHYLFEIPAEVGNGSEAIEIEFVIGGNTYTYKVR